jgi:hypothetical protein
VDNGKAVAYVCDGNSLEAWLQGTVVGNKIAANGKNGSFTGTILDRGDGPMDVAATINGDEYTATIDKSDAPAGVYEARIAAPNIHIGWAVLRNGSQIGVENNAGIEVPAPLLNLKDNSFRLKGETYHATRKISPYTVVAPQ